MSGSNSSEEIRLSTTERRGNTSGVLMVGWVAGGIPVSIDPVLLYPTPTQIGAPTIAEMQVALLGKQNANEKGAANGFASLDGSGRVPTSQLPASGGGGAVVSSATPQNLGPTASAGSSADASRADHVHRLPSPADIGAAIVNHTHSIGGVVGLQLALENKIELSQKGAISGIAPLGSDSKVPSQYLPAGIDASQLSAKADVTYVNTQLGLLNNSIANKADVTYVNTGLAGKADTTALTNGLALKANANDTRIVNAVQPGYLTPIEAFTGAYTAIQDDANKLKRYTGAADANVTLPALAVGTTIRFRQGSTGKMTFVPGTNQVIESFGNLFVSGGQRANILATVISTNVWDISGNLA